MAAVSHKQHYDVFILCTAFNRKHQGHLEMDVLLRGIRTIIIIIERNSTEAMGATML